jgi:GSCFA family
MAFITAISDLKHGIRAHIPLWLQDTWDVGKRRRRLRKRLNVEPDSLAVEQGNDRFSEGHEWYRGEQANYMPTRTNLFEAGAIDQYILPGWLPIQPFVTREHRITAFGSCFAAHVSQFLSQRGYKVYGEDGTASVPYVIRCGEGMVNTFALAQQFQWSYGEKEFDEALWYDQAGREAGYDGTTRERTRQIFERTDVFLMTLGLSEVWYNKRSGDVFWRAIPRSKFDPAVHGFKVSTVAENLHNLETIYRIIRRHRPEAVVIFTLSPVPLTATFRPVSCVTANAVSKSILRVALDEFMRGHSGEKGLFYFPAYEIAKEYFCNPFRGDNRHVRGDVVKTIMRAFARHYLID